MYMCAVHTYTRTNVRLYPYSVHGLHTVCTAYTQCVRTVYHYNTHTLYVVQCMGVRVVHTPSHSRIYLKTTVRFLNKLDLVENYYFGDLVTDGSTSDH